MHVSSELSTVGGFSFSYIKLEKSLLKLYLSERQSTEKKSSPSCT